MATNNVHGEDCPSRRPPHTAKACDECKRRKIRCNGATPCRRCGRLTLECRYRLKRHARDEQNSSEVDAVARIEAQMASLSAKVDRLIAERHLDNHATLTGLELASNCTKNFDPSLISWGSFRMSPEPPQFRITSENFGVSTSSVFALQLAEKSLRTMHAPSAQQHVSPQQSPESRELTSVPDKALLEPFQHISPDETRRLLDVHTDNFNSVFPVLSINTVRATANAVYMHLDMSRRIGLGAFGEPIAAGLDDIDVDILKMVLSLALFLEGRGRSELGSKLRDSVKHAVDSCASALNAGIRSLTLIVLMAQYHFHQDEEIIAWRTLGLAVRLAQQLGLNRKLTLFKRFTEDQQHTAVVRLFWSIYVLDRRLSVVTGLPYFLRDSDIDEHLPKPDNGVPFLRAMVNYTQLIGCAWNTICRSPAAANSYSLGDDEDVLYRQTTQSLHCQLLQWYGSVPKSLQFNPQQSLSESTQIRTLQTMLYLQNNELCLLLYRPLLLTPDSLRANLNTADFITTIAKDTISVLFHLHKTSDIYAKLVLSFNNFLSSALAVLFLAVAHGPDRFAIVGDTCMTGIQLAKTLLQELAQVTGIGQRLYRTMNILDGLMTRVGLFQLVSKDEYHELPNKQEARRLQHRHTWEVHGRQQEPQSISDPDFDNGILAQHDYTPFPYLAGSTYDSVPQLDNEGINFAAEMVLVPSPMVASPDNALSWQQEGLQLEDVGGITGIFV